MKKWALGVLGLVSFALGQQQALPKSQIFIGVTTGFSTFNVVKQPYNNAFLWGLKAGYQYNLNRFVSLRGQMDYIQTLKPTAFNTDVYSFFNIHMDMVNDFYRRKKFNFGTFVGLGFGYFQSAMSLHSSVDHLSFMGYNGVLDIGVGGTIAQKQRVELGIKIPFGQIQSTRPKPLAMDFYYWLVSYAYLF
ncbi:outer membrane beta-barrel protein [Helicobacter ailurogastricus]|uniref:Putative n=1 Tax=Helicobacter ailurogastricus TaxID=1578720 RepID=A0A0K2XXQ4_9HELI|nr:outer membrane beta-barrel protein [Helicobacter ailurogastricus]BDQ29023.1 membrane protein [Helicobacter ailurogastricus]GMB91280.1 Putative outer membrane protein [Helicobacter ailurogastricus]CRF51916.1 putative [Helicobacter ailurogastricus]